MNENRLPPEFQRRNLDQMEVFPPKETVTLRERLATMSKRTRNFLEDSVDHNAYKLEKLVGLFGLSTIIAVAEAPIVDHVLRFGNSPEAVGLASIALSLGLYASRFLSTSEVKSLADIRGKKIKL